MEYFRPYEGQRPYIFISYAHADSDKVMEVVEHMHQRGYRIWYDEGIEVGSEWPECIASHLAGAHLMIGFISNAYMKSDNCRKEMHFAVSKKIKVVNVFLEETKMTLGMEMQIGNIFALMKYQMSDQVFFEKLYAAPLLRSEDFVAAPGEVNLPELKRARDMQKKPEPEKPKPEKPKKGKAGKIVALCLLVLLLAAVITLGTVGYFTGYGQRIIISHQLTEPVLLSGDTEAVFQEEIFEDTARAYTGIDQGSIYVSDLAGLTELYIIGNDYYFEAPGDIPAAEQGELHNLSDLQYFTSLDKLTITGQRLGSLETLPESELRYLYISDCQINDLQGIGALPELRELRVEDCPLRELGDLDHCLNLTRLSLIGTTVNDYKAIRPLTELRSFEVSNASLSELKIPMGLTDLTDVSFHNCDLRGKFFRGFDREWNIVNLTLDNCELSSTKNLEDFTGLINLTLISSGEGLDWSGLQSLTALQTVYCDESLNETVTQALGNSNVEIIIQ
jgi:hypothetical protein